MSEPAPADFIDATDLLNYIEQYADTIPVAEMIDGRTVHTTLAELPGRRALYWAFAWLRQGKIPHRVVSAEEIAARTHACNCPTDRPCPCICHRPDFAPEAPPA